MSQNAIAKITEAEQRAEVLCRVAAERAAERRTEMEKKAKAHLCTVENTLTEKNAKNLAQAHEHAAMLIRKKREIAACEAEELTKSAREHMDRAVSVIVWGIVEKCQ